MAIEKGNLYIYLKLFNIITHIKDKQETLEITIVRARELTFLEKVHLHPPVKCHVSHVMCNYFFLYFFQTLVKLFGGGSVINGVTLSCFNINGFNPTTK